MSPWKSVTFLHLGKLRVITTHAAVSHELDALYNARLGCHSSYHSSVASVCIPAIHA